MMSIRAMAGWVANGFIRHANVLPQEWLVGVGDEANRARRQSSGLNLVQTTPAVGQSTWILKKWLFLLFQDSRGEQLNRPSIGTRLIGSDE